MPGVLNQLGPAELNYLRSHEATKGASGMGGGFDTVNEGDEEEEEDEDDEVPDLVENFEDVSNK